MNSRRKPSARTSQLSFESLSIEGGLLSPEWLARLAQLDAGQQTDADYRVPRGLNLRDEIGRFWRIAQAHWSDFDHGRALHAEPVALSERFVTSMLKDVFGFTTLKPTEPLEREGRLFPVTDFALGTRVPVVIAAADSGLDAPSPRFGEGGRKRSAFGLAQEFLNATDEALWGIACDGVTLRILRDNASLTRPAWIEADLGRIFAEERYADFAALWLLVHETRFGNGEAAPTDCPLETWRAAGREEGTRARDHLRRGVEDALLAFGQGFIAHPDNAALRASIDAGTLTRMGFYQELLRLAYRLIFLITAEERGVLHAPDASAAARSLYEQGYSLRRLRERSVRRSTHDRFADLWEGLKIVFRGAARGEPALALPALGGLFSAGQCPSLDGAKLTNSHLLLGVFKLSWLVESTGLSRVNWRDMGPEELGSVYESLLELVPQVSLEGRRFSFATGDGTKGNARKTSGSYYTPDSLVQVLLDRALEPVVKDTIAANPSDPVEALLSLSVVDPACGSGHFLLAAARRLAVHVARAQANGTPSAGGYRHALRQVVGRCIYGVDLNPMAVELCKVSLWMEAVEPGLPLSFLDAHVHHGNALLGTTQELMAKGVPDTAWEPIEGDNRKIASALKKRNKAESKGQGVLDTLWEKPAANDVEEVTRAVEALERSPDADLAAVGQKATQWEAIQESEAYRHQRFVADAWCAAFLWPKSDYELVDAAPTNALWGQIRDRRGKAAALTESTVAKLAEDYRFFHWHLVFPQVFKRGGFDLVLGNPPWDTLSPDRREYFGRFFPDMRSRSPAEQDAVVERLLEDEHLRTSWERHQRWLCATAHFVRSAGRFLMHAKGNLGKGDFNAYRMFVELSLSYSRRGGYAAQIVPGGIYGGTNATEIRKYLFDDCELLWLWGLSNSTRAWFPDVDISRFAAFAAKRGGRTTAFRAIFGLSEESDLQRPPIDVDADDIRRAAPETYTVPEIRSTSDAAVVAKMSNCYPAFGKDGFGAARRQYGRELEMGHDRHLFTSAPDGVPVYEGRMISHFDHRAKTYESGHGNSSVWKEQRFGSSGKQISPQWRIHSTSVPQKLGDRCDRFRLGFRDMAQPRDTRSFFASLIPPGVICGHTVPTITFAPEYEWLYLPWLAVANSFVMDSLVRKKLSSPHLTFSIVDSLPFPRPTNNEKWVLRVSTLVLRLICTGTEIIPFWNKMAERCLCSPTQGGSLPSEALLDDFARENARAELDAIVAHEVFGLTRNELLGVLDSFPALQRREEQDRGEYRTKRLILEVYDALAEAPRSARQYVTRLDSPPADPRVAHSGRDGEVIPLRPPVRPQPEVRPAAAPGRAYPVWAPDVLPAVAARVGLASAAGRWGTPLTGSALGIAALAAVLRNLGGPASQDEVERAVVLSVLPSLLRSKFDTQAGATWRQLIGAANMGITSIASLAIPWAEVLRNASVQQVLQVDTDGLWNAGVDAADAPSPELDARALVALSWLATPSASTESDDLRTQLKILHAA